MHLGGGEGAADTVARAAAEGKIREAWARGPSAGREAIGVEDLGRIPDGWMAVGDVGRQQHDRVGRDGVADQRVVLDGHARGEPGRRVQTEDLLDHLPRVAEAGKCLDARRPAAEENAALLLEPFPRILAFS